MLRYWCRSCGLPSRTTPCETCGKVIQATSVSNIWESTRRAVSDGVRFFFLLKVALISVVSVFLVLLTLEFILGHSLSGVADFLTKSGTVATMFVLLVAMLAIGLLLLLLQGNETQQVLIEPKGILKRTWLYNPSRLQCWARFLSYPSKSGGDSHAVKRSGDDVWLLAHSEYLAFSDVSRYRLSPRQRKIKLYRPYAFLFMSLTIPGEEYDDAIAMLLSKMKRVPNG